VCLSLLEIWVCFGVMFDYEVEVEFEFEFDY
jgi:hypothetical protein